MDITKIEKGVRRPQNGPVSERGGQIRNREWIEKQSPLVVI